MSQSMPRSICDEYSFPQQNYKAHPQGGELMTENGEMYACKICGNVVQVIASGNGILVCCGQPMQLVEEED